MTFDPYFRIFHDTLRYHLKGNMPFIPIQDSFPKPVGEVCPGFRSKLYNIKACNAKMNIECITLRLCLKQIHRFKYGLVTQLLHVYIHVKIEQIRDNVLFCL